MTHVEVAKRNRAILAERRAGAGLTALARKYGLGVSTVAGIVKGVPRG